ncbi:YjcZ family sporulation protein [Peribacillus frigoritolerans]|nr:YjcZ family sporulation protein [Peribacillus frigoritolerans]
MLIVLFILLIIIGCSWGFRAAASADAANNDINQKRRLIMAPFLLWIDFLVFVFTIPKRLSLFKLLLQ